jgi:hypothetical protein
VGELWTHNYVLSDSVNGLLHVSLDEDPTSSRPPQAPRSLYSYTSAHDEKNIAGMELCLVL